VGGNPLDTTSIYGLIHAMERRGGIWYAKGGTGALISALVSLAKRHGVVFHNNSYVSEFETDSEGKITALGIGSQKATEKSPCDLAVWGADPQLAYNILGTKRTSLLERIRARTVTSSMGLFVLYFKTKKSYSEVAHHSIILSKRWHGLLKDVFKGKTLPKDPSLYLHRPAATETDLVSENQGDLFYVLAPVPHLGNFSNWQAELPTFQKQVLDILQEQVLPDLHSNLEFAESIDPRYFRDTLHSTLGAGFSIAPTLTQSAWFRFHNRSDFAPNLYFCGAGVHPGGGLHGVITSAKIFE
jgi:phytoene desaturase